MITLMPELFWFNFSLRLFNSLNDLKLPLSAELAALEEDHADPNQSNEQTVGERVEWLQGAELSSLWFPASIFFLLPVKTFGCGCDLLAAFYQTDGFL